MDEEQFDATDEAGNDVSVVVVTPRADSPSVNGPGGVVGKEGRKRYFLGSIMGPELFVQGDGTLQEIGSPKAYRLR